MKVELVDIIRCRNTLGEGVLWDARSQSLWWTDIEESALYRYRPKTGSLQKIPTPERLASFGFIAGTHLLIAAFASGFAFFDPYSGDVDWITRPLAEKSGIRLNDGRVDGAGRFWCGTVTETSGPTGVLYCLHGDGRLSENMHGIRIANTICWSPDTTRMYFADSPQHKIDVHDFDVATGLMSAPRTFAELEGGFEPDGAVTDAEGFLWNAQWGAGRIVRYSPDGGIDHILPLPVSQPTCLSFGGQNLDHLFVTSARKNLSALELEAQPLAGNLFIFKTSTRGTTATGFKPEGALLP